MHSHRAFHYVKLGKRIAMKDYLLKIFCMVIYLKAYGGWVAPRVLRKVFAGTTLHRAWLCGYKGMFVEDDVHYGIVNKYGS